MKPLLVVCATALLLVGCQATPPKYEWGTYEQSMYMYYKDPSKPAEFMQAIARTIELAEKEKRLVPPGLHAEYGYLLMSAGRSQDALTQFAREKSAWPESTSLMNKMSTLAQTQPGNQGGTK